MLSILNPMHNDIKLPHDYSSFKGNPSRYSPPESPRNLPPFFNAQDSNMNNSHRGLPPPPGMNLPPPDRSSTAIQSLGHLPAPPQWNGQDESMRVWLHAKAEEDRRKQEEEKTKQETLRLDQRKVEQTMLRESLQGGVPPPMVPFIFAHMGGTNVPSHTMEWAQQYISQLSIQNQQQQQQIQAAQQQQQQHQQQQQQEQPQQQLQPPQQQPHHHQQQQHQHQQHHQPQHLQHQPQHQQPHMSPDLHRDNRMIPTNPYGAGQSLPSTSTTNAQSTSSSRALVHSATGSTGLTRLNTGEMQPLPPAAPPSRQIHPSQQQQQQQQSSQADQSSGPGLFFHHWTPPTNNSNNHQPPTPSGKSTQGSPFSQHAPSHLRSDYQNSPKKRKATAGAGVTSQPADPSPNFSSGSSRDREPSPGKRPRPHSRQHSHSPREADARPTVRPSSRQQRQEELGNRMHEPRRQWTGSSSGSGEDHLMRG